MTKPIKKSDNKRTRTAILESAADLTGVRRNGQYGEPEVNLACAVALVSAYEKYAGNKHSKKHDLAITQGLLKLARIATGERKNIDNYTDVAGYFAIAGELGEQP